MLVVDVLHETPDRGEAARMQAAWQNLLEILIAPPIEAQHGVAVATLIEIIVIKSTNSRFQVVAARPEETPAISTEMIITVTAAVHMQIRKSFGHPEVQPPPTQRKPVAGNNHGRSYLSGKARRWSAGDAYH